MGSVFRCRETASAESGQTTPRVIRFDASAIVWSSVTGASAPRVESSVGTDDETRLLCQPEILARNGVEISWRAREPGFALLL
jgi:hypothetical protein